MTRSRKLLLIAAVPLGLAAIVFGLACLPPVQTWAARRVLSAQPGVQAELGRVSVGWSSLDITDLTLRQPGMVLRLPSAEVRMPIAAALGGRIDVKQLTARGWTLELTDGEKRLAQAPSGPAKEPAPTDWFQLPVALTLGEVDLAGRLTTSRGSTDIVVSGGGVGQGSPGTFKVEAAFQADAQSDLAVDKIQANTTVSVTLADATRLQGVLIDLTATASGGQLHQPTTLRVKAASSRAAQGGQTHSLSVAVDDDELLQADMTVADGTVRGTWKINAADDALTPFALGLALPKFTARGEGRFSTDADGIRPEASGNLRLNIADLRRIAPELEVVGPLAIASEFDVSRKGDLLRVKRLQAEVSGKQPVLRLEALQEFTLDPGTGDIGPTQPLNDLMKVTAEALPLAWARPWLPGYALAGGDARGEWRLALADRELRLRPVIPLTVSGVSLDKDGKALLRQVDVTLALGCSRGGAGLKAELTELSLRRDGRVLGRVSARLERKGAILAMDGDCEAELAPLLAQPFAPEGVAVTDGRIRGGFSAVLGAEPTLELTVDATGLRGAARAALPDVSLKASARQSTAGRIDLNAPLSLSADGRRSDALLKAVLEPDGERLKVTASLDAEIMHAADLTALGALSADKPKQSATTPVAKPASPAESKPFWSGLSGEVSLNVARLVYAPGVEVTGIHGKLTLGPDGLSLDDLRALVGATGKLQAGGRIMHDGGRSDPYSITGRLNVAGFNPGPFLRAAGNVKNPPVLEGNFDLDAELSGRAAEPGALFGNGLGKVRIAGSGGTLRALGVKLANQANLASPLLGILGGVTGNQTALRYAAGAEVVRQLSAVKFDSLRLNLDRDSEDNLKISDLFLDSAAVKLTGDGMIRKSLGAALPRRPLSVDLHLFARGRLANELSGLGLLAEEADDQGFRGLVEPIHLGGSLVSVETGQLQRLIDRALR